VIIFKYFFESQILEIRNLNTKLNYLSSKVLSLYCVFEVQNLVLCSTCEPLKFLDYKIMMKLWHKLHLILPLLVTFHQNLIRIYFGKCFEKNVVLYAIYSKKLQ